MRKDDNARQPKFEVTVIYNGVSKVVTANPHQAVQALLQHALNAFNIRQNRENFGLFMEGPQPLDVGISVEAAGIMPDSRILLRPRQVRGG